MHRFFLPALALLVLIGCARQELYVVLPNADGRPGAGKISVMEGNTTTVLNQPYATAEARSGQAAAIPPDPGEARIVFNQALAARPILPAHFRLYFLLGSDQLTPESQLAYRSVFDDIKRRAAYEVEVIGHTDSLSDVTYNQRLSLERAGAVRTSLVRDGLDPNAISIAGRGKLDLLIPTADQTSEPRNRRVEITVR
jgi:outer membrane protein OmpA-like peptidoglycan-associated protein